MKKFQIVFLFVFLVGCSSSQEVFPAVTPGIALSPSLVPTETVIHPTQTLTPMPTFTPTITPTAIDGGAGKIAFTSERDGYQEIYVMDADGSELTKLANDITPKFSPAWSPDGKKIAFGSNNNDSGSLYIMNSDGSNLIKLIDTNEISTYDLTNPDLRFDTGCCRPVWSPDGTKIAFKVAHYIGCCFTAGYIHMLGADGSYLVSIPINVWEDPVWSPDSQKIVSGAACGPWGICVMNADGTELINLANTVGIDGWPNWSPDGKVITFSSSRIGTNDIFVANVDGTNLVNLTNNNDATDLNPIWSPDGKKIVFHSYQTDTSDIYVMNADGTNLINLTNHVANDTNPVWSPDSTKIAFVSERDGNSEIYVVDADGSNPVRLTNNDAKDYSPVWSP